MRKIMLYIILYGVTILNSGSTFAPEKIFQPAENIEWLTIYESLEDIKNLENLKNLPDSTSNIIVESEKIVVAKSPPTKLITTKLAEPQNKRFTELYEQTIKFIKKHEGYAGGKKYKCAAGFLTIGYGHVIKNNESFPEKISKREAELILRKDFNKCIKLAKENSTNLTDNQLLAVSHFIFAKGIGNYLKSTLKQKIDNGENPTDEFLKWCVYHSPDGKKKKSKYSLNIRKWEIDMYFNGEPIANDTIPLISFN